MKYVIIILLLLLIFNINKITKIFNKDKKDDNNK